MFEVLQTIKEKLLLIPDIETCKIGLEDDISPADYPIIRIVASSSDDLGFMRIKHTVRVYFGFDLNKYDGLESAYDKLYSLEKLIRESLTPSLEPYLCTWKNTISDEDRLKGYKILCSVFEVEG